MVKKQNDAEKQVEMTERGCDSSAAVTVTVSPDTGISQLTIKNIFLILRSNSDFHLYSISMWLYTITESNSQLK